MIFHGKRILFIGAHPDDIEIGACALIHNMHGKCEILCATLSDNQKNPLLKNVVNEHRASMSVLGVSEDHDLIESFETRKFPDLRQEVLEYLLKLRVDFEPEIVFCHSENDMHQDHNVITQEALRAYRGLTLLGFDVVRSSYNFFPHFLVEVSEQDAAAKIEALSQYKTYKDKYYFEPTLLKATMIRHGTLAERKLAEGFDILRIVGRFESPTSI